MVAILSFLSLVVSDHVVAGVLVFPFYYVGGVGVRERSRYAAAVVVLMYAADTLYRPGVLRIILGAVLLSNLRATWIASRWRPESEVAILPPRLSETWGDKLSDQLPMWLWPKVRIPYYVFSACFLGMVTLGLVIALRRHL